MAHTIRILWLADEKAAEEFEVKAKDEERARQLFRRLSAVLKALAAEEARRQEGGG